MFDRGQNGAHNSVRFVDICCDGKQGFVVTLQVGKAHHRYNAAGSEALATVIVRHHISMPDCTGPIKKSPRAANISDICTKPAPSYSLSPPPSSDLDSVSLAPLLLELALLALLFILLACYTTSRCKLMKFSNIKRSYYANNDTKER